MLTFLLRRLTEGSSYAGIGMVVAGVIDAYLTGGMTTALPLILGGAAAYIVPDKGDTNGR